MKKNIQSYLHCFIFFKWKYLIGVLTVTFFLYSCEGSIPFLDDLTNNKQEVEKDTLFLPKDKKDKLPSFSSIKYDLSCMTKGNKSAMGAVNFIAKGSDKLIGWATDEVSPKSEMKYGAEFHKAYSKEAEVNKSDKLTHIVNQLLREMPSSNYEYHIFKVADTMVNSFTVGGYIYVFEGMIDFTQSKDELVAVIAHEISHNELGHINDKIRVHQSTTEHLGDGLGSLVNALGNFITASFNQKDEIMADLYGVDIMIHAGYNPCSAVTIWKRFSENESYSAGKELLRTHPYSSIRAACVEHHIQSNYSIDCVEQELLP